MREWESEEDTERVRHEGGEEWMMTHFTRLDFSKATSIVQEKEKLCSFLSSALLYSCRGCHLLPPLKLQANKINVMTNSILEYICFFGLAWETDHHL